MVNRNASSIRRLFTQKSNPELALVVSIASALGADLEVVATKKSTSSTRPKKRELVAA